MCVTSVYGTNSAIQILCQYDKLSDLYVINHGIFLVNIQWILQSGRY